MGMPVTLGYDSEVSVEQVSEKSYFAIVSFTKHKCYREYKHNKKRSSLGIAARGIGKMEGAQFGNFPKVEVGANRARSPAHACSKGISVTCALILAIKCSLDDVVRRKNTCFVKT